MVETLSTLGLQTSVNNNLSGGQKLMSLLTEQLTTGVYSSNLSDYSASDGQKLLNASSTMAEQSGFLDVIGTLETRITLYDTTLTGIEDTLGTAYSAIIQQPTYDEDKTESLAGQIEGYMDQMTYYLNQKVGERYIYAGARYNTAPVVDISTLPVPPTETDPYLSTGTAVPSYDTSYDPLDPEKEVPAAHTKNSTAIDTSSTITYGINSNEKGFQQVIMGLRWAYAATQDEENYEVYMDRANSLITEGTANVRATHTSSTNANTQIESAKSLITDNISALQTQADDISKVDLNEVSLKITLLTTQLQASYSATSTLLKLSLVDYL